LSEYLPDLPIGVIPAAKGASPLVCAGSDLCWGRRNAEDPADPSTLYGNSLAKARSAGGVELIVMHQGETDATNSTPSATYGSELALLAQNYRADLGDVPLFMCQLGRSTTDIWQRTGPTPACKKCRVAQHDADDPPRIYLAATGHRSRRGHNRPLRHDDAKRAWPAHRRGYRVPLSGCRRAARVSRTGDRFRGLRRRDSNRHRRSAESPRRQRLCAGGDINGFVVLDDGAARAAGVRSTRDALLRFASPSTAPSRAPDPCATFTASYPSRRFRTP
jgi:hypothetical protein